MMIQKLLTIIKGQGFLLATFLAILLKRTQLQDTYCYKGLMGYLLYILKTLTVLIIFMRVIRKEKQVFRTYIMILGQKNQNYLLVLRSFGCTMRRKAKMQYQSNLQKGRVKERIKNLQIISIINLSYQYLHLHDDLQKINIGQKNGKMPIQSHNLKKNPGMVFL